MIICSDAGTQAGGACFILTHSVIKVFMIQCLAVTPRLNVNVCCFSCFFLCVKNIFHPKANLVLNLNLEPPAVFFFIFNRTNGEDGRSLSSSY